MRTIDAFLDASHLLSLALLLALRRAQLPYALLLLALQLRIDSLPPPNTNAVHRGGSGERRCMIMLADVAMEVLRRT